MRQAHLEPGLTGRSTPFEIQALISRKKTFSARIFVEPAWTVLKFRSGSTIWQRSTFPSRSFRPLLQSTFRSILQMAKKLENS